MAKIIEPKRKTREVSDCSRAEFLSLCIRYGERMEYHPAFPKHPYKAYYGDDPADDVIAEAIDLDLGIRPEFDSWMQEYFIQSKKNRKPKLPNGTPRQIGAWLRQLKSDEFLGEVVEYLQKKMETS